MISKIKPLTKPQVERLRLLLSTYQDGTGMLVNKDGTFLPGWRDFERSVASALGGVAQESKAIFDVIAPIDIESNRFLGVSCKMRKELGAALKNGKVLIELSNSSGKFWDVLKSKGINSMEQVQRRADESGEEILNLVKEWHRVVENIVDLSLSYHLVLQYNAKTAQYKLFQFPIQLPDSKTLDWSTRVTDNEGKASPKCLVGKRGGDTLIEWYGTSGGQLKYYPQAEEATWESEIFTLEPLPQSSLGYGVVQKAKIYFPEKWGQTE